MERNFKNESLINFCLRVIRAIKTRARGRFYFLFRVFGKGTSFYITIGKNARFINSKCVILNRGVSFGDNIRIECFPTISSSCMIKIGCNTSFGDNLHIGALDEVKIGSNVLGASKILIIDHNHGNTKNLENEFDIPPRLRKLTTKGKIVIEDNVWIGESVVILSGSHISEGAIISSNSIVKGFVESKTIYRSS